MASWPIVARRTALAVATKIRSTGNLRTGSRPSIRPDRALNSGAKHQPPLGRGKVGAGVRGAAVVPQQEIADAPSVLVDELALLRVVVYRVEQPPTLVLGDIKHFHRHQPIDVDRFPAGVLMGAKYWMLPLGKCIRTAVIATDR